MTQQTSHSESTALRSTSEDKLVLYMIGHAPDAGYLERLLKQIKPILRHVCFVNTDDTEDCFKVIEASGLSYNYEKHTFASREEFDFSLVRNKAREMAAKVGGWSIWFDCDDTIEDPERILKKMKDLDSEAYALPYEVSKHTDNLFKIRIHRASEWKWVNKVHEELVPMETTEDKKQVILFKEISVKHSPDDEKSNHDFHIELLKKQIKMAPNDYCYLAKEHFNKCDFEGAIPWIEKAIAIHDVSVEIYGLWLMLAIAQSNLGNEAGMIDSLHSAIRERPHRREAYYYLAEYCGKKGGKMVDKGLAYIRACNAQEDNTEPLTHSLVYDLNCHKLHARYLQKLGRLNEALEQARKVKKPDDETKDIIEECQMEIENEQQHYL